MGARGLHSSGLEQVSISTVAQLGAVDPKTQGIIVSASVGDKKRVAIITEAKGKNIKILNIKNPEEIVKTVEARLAEKKKAREEKAKKAKASEKKKDEKKLADKVAEEDKKDAEKQEKDKMLTKA